MAGFSYEVAIPGKGKFQVNSPSELSDQQAYQAALQEVSGPNPAEGMSTFQQGAAGFGKSMVDMVRGVTQRLNAPAVYMEKALDQGKLVKSLGMETMAEFSAKTDADIAASRKRDKPLLDTTAGFSGNVAWTTAVAVPAMFLPGANTALGAGVVGGLLGAAQPTIGGESALLNTAVGAGGGMLAQAGANKVAGMVATRLANQTNQGAARQATNAVRDATLKEAQQAGYVFPPTQVKPSMTNTVVEAVSGKIKTAQAAAFKNQEVTNNIVKKALGIAPEEPLTRAALKGVRDQAGDAYRVVEGLQSVNWDKPFEQGVKSLVPAGTGAVKNPAKAEIVGLADDLMAKASWTGAELVEDIKLLREMGRANVNAASRAGGDTAKSMLGKAQLKASGLLEDLAERNLANNKAPASAIQELRNARQLIAQTYDVEKALNEASGNVNASVVAGLLKKGKPLTGGLETVGKTAAAFPKAMQFADQIGSVNPLSAVDAMSGAAAGVLTGNAAAVAAPLARPGARSLLLSKPYQSLMVGPENYGPGLLTRGADRALWNPLVNRSFGPTGAQGLLGYAGE